MRALLILAWPLPELKINKYEFSVPYENVLCFIFRILHDHGGPYHDDDDVFYDAHDSRSS